MEMVETPLAQLGDVPNNPDWPLKLYLGAMTGEDDTAAAFEALFARNGWPPAWRAQIDRYHHYHSVTHEALGIARGEAEVQFGGPEGPIVEVAAGDAVWIPAGVAHKRISSTDDLLVVGAYPTDRAAYDHCNPEEEDVGEALARVAQVKPPSSDPVTGDAI